MLNFAQKLIKRHKIYTTQQIRRLSFKVLNKWVKWKSHRYHRDRFTVSRVTTASLQLKYDFRNNWRQAGVWLSVGCFPKNWAVRGGHRAHTDQHSHTASGSDGQVHFNTVSLDWTKLKIKLFCPAVNTHKSRPDFLSLSLCPVNISEMARLCASSDLMEPCS